MGLDMSIKTIKRSDYNSIKKEMFWYESFFKSKELIYWRKKYDIHSWFLSNIDINEECSFEIPKEKLLELKSFLIKEKEIESSEKLINIINNMSDENVIFYTYTN